MYCDYFDNLRVTICATAVDCSSRTSASTAAASGIPITVGFLFCPTNKYGKLCPGSHTENWPYSVKTKKEYGSRLEIIYVRLFYSSNTKCMVYQRLVIITPHRTRHNSNKNDQTHCADQPVCVLLALNNFFP